MRVTKLCASLSILILALAARADFPQNWDFDLATTGSDVFWTSPTSLPADADWYTVDWQITQMVATVKFSIFPPFQVDVTDQIPPEYQSGLEVEDGPAPLVAMAEYLVYPEPPEPPAIGGNIVIGLDAAGFGYMTFTDVELGTVTVEVPPFGLVTVQVLGVQVIGDIVAEAFWYVPGDMNCSKSLGFDDINPFVLALTNADAYAQAYPLCDRMLADINGNGDAGFDDINPFVALLVGQ
jgi:hypothetical protein